MVASLQAALPGKYMLRWGFLRPLTRACRGLGHYAAGPSPKYTRPKALVKLLPPLKKLLQA